MLESHIQAKILKYLSDRAYAVKIISASRAGVPDIICCYRGIYIAIECKHPSRRRNISPLQEHNIKCILENGGRAIVATDVDIVKNLLDTIDIELGGDE